MNPVVLQEFQISNAPDWLSFWSAWRARLTNAITDSFMKDPQLAGPNGVLHGTAFTQYQLQVLTIYIDTSYSCPPSSILCRFSPPPPHHSYVLGVWIKMYHVSRMVYESSRYIMDGSSRYITYGVWIE
jgi:hypothetical protein